MFKHNESLIYCLESSAEAQGYKSCF